MIKKVMVVAINNRRYSLSKPRDREIITSPALKKERLIDISSKVVTVV